ncbi:GSCFA domain-containing protein [Sphingomonas crusticola]|uniref:GSCFA domain-containing protein n=1 Tax=Sphingomonas crusticola TaxID=1697973 RepID=UPI000E286531|nr:GSCFA domain-containing protein [Sphingomonas crusticola]
MSNPYRDLPDHHYWRRAISATESHLIDPVTASGFRIGPSDRVATAGSCFAQHIARAIAGMGLHYFVAESGEGLSDEEARRRQYGLFSARYGNIYTAAQWRQLLEEAFDGRQPVDKAWPGRNGGWIDPFRQTVEPDGFSSREAVAADRELHLAAVRRLVAELDVFVFTLGLTEAWRSRADGSIYPLAPGVAGGSYEPDLHEFVNFSAAEVEADLAAALERMRAINPRVRVLLTVSPVPLIATYEDRHVLVSTAYSKAALRVAADAVSRRFAWVDYFPSYEIITGPATAGVYFEEDMREVNELGVAHVMRVFARHYVAGVPLSAAAPVPELEPGGSNVICDEAMIEALRPGKS